jgi:hypothetical protein
MYKYTVDGLAAKEAADAAAAAAAAAAEAAAGPSGAGADGASAAEVPGTPKVVPAGARQYQYGLKGIVVHSGSAFAGHYYSYIKVRLHDPSLVDSQRRAWCSMCLSCSGQVRKQAGQRLGADQWFCFDDNQVSNVDASLSLASPSSQQTIAVCGGLKVLFPASSIACLNASGGALGPGQPGPRLLRRQAVRGAPGRAAHPAAGAARPATPVMVLAAPRR